MSQSQPLLQESVLVTCCGHSDTKINNRGRIGFTDALLSAHQARLPFLVRPSRITNREINLWDFLPTNVTCLCECYTAPTRYSGSSINKLNFLLFLF